MASLAKSHAKGKGQSNGKDKAQALRQRIDASLGVLARAVDDVRASDVLRVEKQRDGLGLDRRGGQVVRVFKSTQKRLADAELVKSWYCHVYCFP